MAPRTGTLVNARHAAAALTNARAAPAGARTALLSRLHELHPYETPECVAVRVAAGAPRYLAWLEEALAPESPGTGSGT